MAEKDRISLDDDGSQKKSIDLDLLKDVAEVTRQAKERMEQDKARDKQLATAGRNRALIYAIICFAALVMIFIAWKINFGGGSENVSPGSQDGFYPMRGATSQPAQPPQTYQPTQPTPIPAPAPAKPAPPPSEPVRRTPTETYDEGPDQDAM